MIGVLLFVTSRGEIILSRSFREGFAIRNVSDTFRDDIIGTKKVERSPINIIDKTCFMHMRFENLYLVAVSHANVNCFVAFQLMVRLMQILRDYFGHVEEITLKDNFVTIHEIIDEIIDFGYPQVTEVDLLKSYITTGGAKTDILRRAKDAEKVTIKATGKIPWRQDGIVYKDNEVFLDVIEEVNILMSQNGDVLQREVVGRVVMKGFLSGMPECQIVLNDKSLVSAGAEKASYPAGDVRGVDVQLDDVTFHSCVRLNAYDADRSISFIPPDGEFVLMRYRSCGNVIPPMRVLLSRCKEVSKTRMEVDFRLKCDIDAKNHATNVVVKIPCPLNTANVKIRVGTGKAKYDPTVQAIVWKIKRMQGESAAEFSAEVNLIAATLSSSEKLWSRPPIAVNFSAEMFTASGLQVQQLKITEPKLNYQPKKWVRYLSTGGQYQCRL